MDKHSTSTACHAVGQSYTSSSAQRDYISHSSSAAVAAVRALCLPTILDRSMASLSCSGRRLLRSSSPPLLVPVELCPWVVALPKLLSCPRRSVQPLALGSDASCCCCWGLGQGLGKMRSADDRATSQQGAAFGVPLSAAHPGASPRRPCVARVESICDGSATLVDFSERTQVFSQRFHLAPRFGRSAT